MGDRKESGPAPASTGFAEELAFLLEGEHTIEEVGGKSLLVVARRRALEYVYRHWEPVIVGRRRNGDLRTHWRYMPTGRRFSPAKLKTLWENVRLDLGPGHRPGFRFTLWYYFSAPDLLAGDYRWADENGELL